MVEHLLGNEDAADRAVRLARSLLTPESQPDIQVAVVAHRYRMMGHEEDADLWNQVYIARSGVEGWESATAEEMVNAALSAGNYEAALEQLQRSKIRLDRGRLPNSNALHYIILNMHGDPRLDEPDFMAARRDLGYVPGSPEWCIFPSCDRSSD